MVLVWFQEEAWAVIQPPLVLPPLARLFVSWAPQPSRTTGTGHQPQFPAGLRAVDWPGFDFSVLERVLIPVVTPGFTGFIWLIFIL
jgi:hypothetical protein